MQYPDWIWHNGGIKPWAEATTHVMSHVLHYGSSVFEGIRAYATPNGTAIFRLSDHNRRLFASARIYEIAIPYTLEQINAACREVIAANGNTTDYLRPVAYRGLGGFGLSADTPIDVAVATWKMGQYLGAGVVEDGIDACVSSWQRFAPNTIPAGAKAGGNYLSGQLVAREARRQRGRTRSAARIPVPVRRVVHVWNGGGSHPDPLDRRPPDRRRQGRAGDAADAGIVLRVVRWFDAGQIRLARARMTCRSAS
jgi:branched-subunit amino acid aminotransferase/4-amino-4-deoxychorismate lyase